MKKLITTTLIGTSLLVSTTLYAQEVNTNATSAAQMLTEEQAWEIALAEVGGTVQKTELEDEHGTQVYDVYVELEDGSVTEVELDAITGEVLEVESRDDDGFFGWFDGDNDDYDDNA